MVFMRFATTLLASCIEYRTAACGAFLYLTWRYANRSRLTRTHHPAHDVAAIERRIIRAQVLYAFGAALCVINRYWSIAFIFLVQLNHALVPRLRRPARS